MNHDEFLSKLDKIRVVEAIAKAERTTSGEIRVFVSREPLHAREDVMARAAARFKKLGLTATRERNGVLLYFMPRARKFAIIGDRGIDEKCGSGFWETIAACISDRLARDCFTEAITDAVSMVGEALSRHFPRRPDDQDELPNDVVSD
jgi:uncharacterized membrane protein